MPLASSQVTLSSLEQEAMRVAPFQGLEGRLRSFHQLRRRGGVLRRGGLKGSAPGKT